MIIKIDCREKKLSNLCESYLKLSELKNITLTSENLILGDIIICDDDGIEMLIIERKTLNDLAASIGDGRYNEQSYRLMNDKTHNHHIIYLLEGDIEMYVPKYTRIDKKALYSAMTMLQLYKGFSLFRTNTQVETSVWLLHMTDKIGREKAKSQFYYNKIDGSGNMVPSENYSTVIKRAKKSNIDENNIGEIMLSQIPSVSNNVAQLIMSKYKNILTLIDNLKQDEKCLDDLKMNCNGKERKISKTSVANIKKFLMNN